MSDPDNFLSRWSRRKLEPQDAHDEKAPETKPGEASADAVESQVPAAAAQGQQDQKQEPAFDPSTLPSLDSITAGTDVRDFLKPGVPLSLSRAALRRAWTSDPAIRDFIEIAENQWDFTNDSIAGFGQLDPADVPRLLAKLMGTDQDSAGLSSVDPVAEPLPPSPEEVAQKSEQEIATGSECAVTAPAHEQNVSGETAEQPVEQAASQRSSENGATQNDGAGKKLDYAAPRLGHGRALPT